MLGLGVFAIVWGARLVVIDRYGSDLPKWDQWSAEGEALFVPFQHDQLPWSALVRPHNEHRILFTRVLALGLFAANGRWDARLECVANATLPALLAAWLCLWGAPLLAPRWRLAWPALVVGLMAPPIAWDNVLSGFHSQQYFLVAFSLGAFALLETPALSLRWWFAAAAAFCALCSMGSGLLAPLAVLAVLLLTSRGIRDIRIAAPALTVCTAAVALGVALQFSIATSPALHAHSVGEYLATATKYLAWPFARYPGHTSWWFMPIFFLAWLPWSWLTLRLWRRRTAGSGERAVCAAGLWALLQIAASAFARGAGAPDPASRYVDNLVVGVGANALAFLLLARACAFDRPPRPLLARLAFAGVALAITGLGVHTTYQMLYRLPLNRQLSRNYESNVRAYLASGDTSVITGAGRVVPHTDPAALLRDLDQPDLRSILPASVQPAATRAGPLSRFARIAAVLGPIVILIGLLLVVAAIAPARPRPDSLPA